MARIRAYKIAEELGIDRNEIIKRAAEVGVTLKSPMVGLEEDQAEELRRRLGGGKGVDTEVRRVGSTVIRRRRKVTSKPKAEVPASEAPVAEAEPARTTAGEAPGEAAAESEPAAPVTAEPGALPPAPDIEPPAVVPETPQPAAAPTPAPSTAPGVARPAAAAPAAAPGGDAAAQERARGAMVRRQVIEGANLREQESMARMAQGNVQRRLERRRQLVEQQSRMQPRRRGVAGRTGGKRVARTAKRKKAVRIEGPLALAELSRLTGTKIAELYRKIRELDTELERDERLDVETATMLAEELGFEVQAGPESLEQRIAAAPETEDSDLEPRQPIVTVMGHVDHGKTSLLDAIRNTKVVEGEAGGITQHIGAYTVEAAGQRITFVDTPGHEAFTQMRARGAQITDIAVLVVAADDGIMPQTVEAINHARAAGVPIVVAINKIDRPNADPDRVRRGLLEQELVPEELGGDTICVEVSATQGTNLDKLLEMLALQAEILELRARKKGPARGTVIEARLDKGRGPIATVLVNEGTLKRGDVAVVGTAYGKLRSLLDENGSNLKEVGPGDPVQVVGLSGVPNAGDELIAVKNDRDAKALVEERVGERQRAAAADDVAGPVTSAEDLFAQLDDSDEKQLLVVLKSDVHGTMEAARELLEKLSTEKVVLKIIHAGVGAINERDVDLAVASHAVVVGFHVRPEPAARKTAEKEGVEIRTYDVVYELVDEATRMMLGLLPPKVIEKVEGHAEVLKLFMVPRVGTIAGCTVPEGTIKRSNSIRVLRDGKSVYFGKVASLRRVKDDVREVQAGLECGIRIENFNDVKVGDLLESVLVEETPDTL